MKTANEIFTIGHSTHPIDVFIDLLRQNQIAAVADVRSAPYSQFQPQFNRESLKSELQKHGIAYVYLGAELGARSKDPNCYIDGKVQYRRLAQTQLFRKGLERLKTGHEKFRIAVMCTEKEPLECHRTLLVARELRAMGIPVKHIHADGHLESHEDAMERLIQTLRISDQDMFKNHSELLEDAYAKQEERVAYVSQTMVRESPGEC
jgi:uncharacterized protein (DUF488 family)